MDDLSHGVKATIIDFGLSLMDVKDPKTGVSSTQFTVLDDTIFNGEGECVVRSCSAIDWRELICII